MDPSTTLFTFMLETDPSVQTVALLGSWDNFSQHYNMERDARRDQGQWRGCHALQTRPNEAGYAVHKRSGGGLRMGHTYHYYYEVNGTTETHNPRQPSTTTCPSLPGQMVNTLEVPIEHSLRLRSCSMNNLRQSDFKTTNPRHKYKTPMPPQPHAVAAGAADARVGSAPAPAIQLMRKRSARSLSPGAKWTTSARRIFGTIRPSSREGNGSARTLADWDADITTLDPSSAPARARSAAPSAASSRSRDISPDALRRFLLGEDAPTAVLTNTSKSTEWDQEDMVEDIDDDDNFATLTTSPTLDSMPFTTLSPPSFMRSASAQLPSMATGLSAPPPRSTPAITHQATSQPRTMQLNIPRSRFISPRDSPAALSPASQVSTESRYDKSQGSFFDDMEDDVVQSRPVLRRSPKHQALMSPAFSGYRLPQPACTGAQKEDPHISIAFGSPSIMAQAVDDGVMPLGHRDVLSLPQLEHGLGDLVDDLSWITGLASSKSS